MNADRRSHDPFAPHPPSDAPPEPPDDVPDGGINQPDTQSSGGDVELSGPGDGLESLRRVDLVELAKREGVASYGTHDDLVQRIRRHRSSE